MSLNPHKREDFFKYLESRSARTSDEEIKDLRMEGPITPVFIYDDLQLLGQNHHIMEGAQYFGPATTLQPEFALLKKELCEPETILFEKEDSLQMKKDLDLERGAWRRVAGELYGVPLDMVFYLDLFYQNKSQTYRAGIPVLLERGAQIIQRVQTYMGIYEALKFYKNPISKLRLAPTFQKPNSPEWLYRYSYQDSGLQYRIDKLLIETKIKDDYLLTEDDPGFYS